jgi:NifB/MoaA-like Fe-S oxidoreductase
VREIEKLQKEFRQTLGVTFAFLGDEIYLKAGLPIPSRRHYGNYPQIEDGVGMIRSFLNSFDKLLRKAEARASKSAEIHRRDAETQSFPENTRTHKLAIIPKTEDQSPKTENRRPNSLNGTILTGEMFAPILRQKIEELNSLIGSQLDVLAVKNNYFGGDVAVAGLLTGQDYLAARDQIKGDFVIIPQHTIKSDEPVLLDGMNFDELKSQFSMPVYPLDLKGLMQFILN